MRDSLEKERQERENQEKEKSITDKEARLAYLKRDTTGANQQEILELQKEINEEKEDYTDTLIDQKIDELEEQNDLAAKQREDQISLLQDQLEELENHPDWNELYKIINDGIGSNGTLVTGSRLQALLEAGAGYDGMSEVQKMDWMDETNTLLKQAVAYEQNVRQLENLTDAERGIKAGQSLTFTNAEGKKLTGVYQSNGDVVVTDGNYKYTYHDVYKDFSGNFKQITDNYDKAQIKKDTKPSNTTPSGGSSSNTGGGGGNTGGSNTGGGGNTSIVKGSRVKAKANTLIYDSYDDKTGERQTFSSNPNYVVLAIRNNRAQVRHVSAKSGVTGWFNLSELTLVSGGGSSTPTTTTGSKKVQVGANVKANSSAKIYGSSTDKKGVAQYFKNDPKYKVLKIENNRAQLRHHTARSGVSGWIDISQLTAYKTGGLVDFTGLAWLDGTKNKPETVLNYKDTQNFMDLKDNLKALRTNGVKKPTQTITNNPNFTINVNVDEISNDYDVDRLVDRVKRDILQNSGYRNVTAINFRK